MGIVTEDGYLDHVDSSSFFDLCIHCSIISISIDN